MEKPGILSNTRIAADMKPGIFFQKRVFPQVAAPSPSSKVLSILDATTGRFTPSGALWLFDSTTKRDARDPALFESLQASLESVLSSYQHWAGRLRFARPSDIADSQRYAGRIVAEWGTSDDLGVDFALAYSTRRLEDIAPTQNARRTDQATWDATSFPQAELLNPSPLALDGLRDSDSLPCATVQLTAFACGGYSIAVHIVHVLADAQALAVFVQQWAAHNQSFAGKTDCLERLSSPVFEPELLDKHASPVSAGPAMEEKAKLSRSLPLHRFDWWGIDDDSYPQWALNTTQNNMSLLPEGSQPLSPASPAPWSTMDVAAPVRHVFFRFSTAKTIRWRSLARSGKHASHQVSRLDAVLAHIWLLINEARAPVLEATSSDSQDSKVYLNLSLGARPRVRPPLPDVFVGSPIFIMHVSFPTSAVTGTPTAQNLSAVASGIRSEMELFTPEAVRAMLHDAAHEEVPQRLWGGFLGQRHVLVTSWTRLDAYKVDFWGDDEDKGRQPRLVRAVMPPLDGLLQVMDTDVEGEMDVGLCLEAQAMERLCRSGRLYSIYDANT